MPTQYSNTLLGDPADSGKKNKCLMSDAVIEASRPNGRASGTLVNVRGELLVPGHAIHIDADRQGGREYNSPHS